jgi:nickel-dependent lactate racemase
MQPRLPPDLRALLDRGATLVTPPAAADTARASVLDLCREALAHPVGAPPLGGLVGPRSRVAIVVSDATREEPRDGLVGALREALAVVPDDQITLVIASGTHAPRPAETALGEELRARYRVVVHDGHDPESCFDAGTTPEGTRVRLDRALQCDLVVSTGRIRPHYFAGYSGGAKGIFPGCALAGDARQNHLFKALPSARLGRLDDNRCRLDMEAAARLLPCPAYLLNVVADVDGNYVGAFAGDLVAAHRAACELARPLFLARGPASRVVVASDLPPVTSSLYQASKLLPPAGALLTAGGTAIMVARCEEGIGPLQVVNEGIYRLGVRHHLPEGHLVRLVSGMSEEEASRSYARPAASLEAALAEAGFGPGSRLDGVSLLWRAGEMIAERTDA